MCRLTKIGAVMNFKSYDIDKSVTVSGEDFHDVNVTFKKLMVSDICTNIVAEVTPPREGYESYRWFNLDVVMKNPNEVMKNGENSYYEGSFLGWGTFYDNAKTYVVLDYFHNGDNFHASEGLTDFFECEPPYFFEIREMSFEGIEFREYPADYAALDVSVPITDGRMMNEKPISFQMGDYLVTLEMDKYSPDGPDSIFPVTITPPKGTRFGFQYGETPICREFLSIDGWGSSPACDFVLSAESKGKEVIRYTAQLYDFHYDEERNVYTALFWLNSSSYEILAPHEGSHLLDYSLTNAARMFGAWQVDQLKLTSFTLYEQTWTEFVKMSGDDMWVYDDYGDMESDIISQYREEGKLYDWIAGDNIDVSYWYIDEDGEEVGYVGLSPSVKIIKGIDPNYYDVDIKALQKKGTCLYGKTTYDYGITNPYYDNYEKLRDNPDYELDWLVDTSDWDYSFRVE